MILRIQRELRIMKTRAHFLVHGVRTGRRPLAKYRLPVLQNWGAMTIGDRAVFYGEECRSLIRTGAKGTLTIGDRVLINSGASIIAAQSVVIGDDVLIGNFVSISDTSSHEIVPGEGPKIESVAIGNNVWIGRGATILPGITIGSGAVIGAGSVVTRDIAPNTVFAGNPARFIRDYEERGITRK